MDERQRRNLYQLAFAQGRTEAALRRVQGRHEDAYATAAADWDAYGACICDELGLDVGADLDAVQATYIAGFVAGYGAALREGPLLERTV